GVNLRGAERDRRMERKEDLVKSDDRQGARKSEASLPAFFDSLTHSTPLFSLTALTTANERLGQVQYVASQRSRFISNTLQPELEQIHYELERCVELKGKDKEGERGESEGEPSEDDIHARRASGSTTQSSGAIIAAKKASSSAHAWESINNALQEDKKSLSKLSRQCASAAESVRKCNRDVVGAQTILSRVSDSLRRARSSGAFGAYKSDLTTRDDALRQYRDAEARHKHACAQFDKLSQDLRRSIAEFEEQWEGEGDELCEANDIVSVAIAVGEREGADEDDLDLDGAGDILDRVGYDRLNKIV
ncbi:hypothetical protein ADUPG1_011484, partial [Aduncisulcus paluster]